LAHQFAVESAHVRADVIEVESLPDVAEQYGVTSVPRTLLNGAVELLGSQTESSLLEAIEALG
jgi:predicted DsbA family dithiol-disulfide isomerase